MAVSLVDTHAHLNGIEFEKTIDEILSQADAFGVHKILTIATDFKSSLESIQLAEKHDCIYAAVGVHPCYVTESTDDEWEQIVDLVDHPKVVAIGETGLDLHWDKTTLERQLVFFRRQIELSQKTKLPFIVHCRESEDEVMTELREAYKQGPLIGIMHSYCGSPEGARESLKMGMHVSFSGMVTFKKNKELRELTKAVPHDRILIETDSPYLAPTPHRGKRNEPAYVRHTAECIADVHGLSIEEFAAMTTENANRLFGF